MRQAGILAAAGLIALEKMPARLREDHENARFLADQLAQVPGLDVDSGRVRTNIIIVGVARTSFDSSKLAGLLKEKGVLVSTVDAKTIRLLTHLDVSRTEVLDAANAFAEVLEKVRK